MSGNAIHEYIRQAYLINNFSPALTVTTLVIELAFCIVMIIEFLSKIISCGWKSYFKTIWCLIDLFNTIVSIYVGLLLLLLYFHFLLAAWLFFHFIHPPLHVVLWVNTQFWIEKWAATIFFISLWFRTINVISMDLIFSIDWVLLLVFAWHFH